MSSQPIGMLDSGIGGLSVLREVRRLLPAESIIYVADQGHLPYGPRPREALRGFVEGISRWLHGQGCKLLVMACNAANAAALQHVREALPTWPIVGMEPAIKPAAERTQTGVIGVITTKATFQGELFASVIDRFAQAVRVETQVCPEFVTLVEQESPSPDDIQRVVAHYLAPLKAAGIDQLVLGCTHFPFLTPYLQAYLGAHVGIIDPAPAVARQVERVLRQHSLLNAAPPHGSEHGSEQGSEQGRVAYHTTGDPAHAQRLIARLVGDTRPVVGLRWCDGTLELR
jgi:glutamate racemase